MKVAQHYFNRGNKKIFHKDFAGAITFFDKGIEINPEFAFAYLNRGIAKNLNQDLENTFYLSQNTDSDDAESEINTEGVHADNFVIQNDAIADFDKAICINPWYAKAYYSRGRVKSGFKNQLSISANSFYRANKKEGYHRLKDNKNQVPDNNQETYAGVMADFDKAIEIDPEFAEAYYTRGLAKNFRTSQPATKDDLSKVQEIDLNFAGALIREALAIDNQIKDFAGAIADFDKAIEINPEFADAYYCRGLVKNYFRNHNSEVVSPVQTFEIDDRFATGSYDDKHAENYHSKDYIGIIADFDMAIQTNPRHAKAYCSRGVVKIFSQDLCEEIILILRNKPIDSGKRDAFRKGKNFNDDIFNKYAGALADFDKAIEINPRFANAYFLRGIIKTYCQDHKGASKDFEKAIVLDPEFKEVYSESGLSSRITEQTTRTYLN